MAMTEEERRAARNEASRRWYLAHKAAKAAAGEAPKKRGRPAAPKAEATPQPKKAKKEVKKEVKKEPKVSVGRPAKTEPVKKAIFSSSKDPNAQLEKQIVKMIKKNSKAVVQVKDLIKEVAPILSDLAKHEDQKFAAKMTKLLVRGLSLDITEIENGKNQVSFNGAKLFRVPKSEIAPAPATPEDDVEVPVPVIEQEGNEDEELPPPPDEIPVDPSKLESVESGETNAEDLDAESREDEKSEDETEDDDDEPSWKGKDPDEMTDEELEEYEEEMARQEEEADLDGRAEMFREMAAQGADFGD